MSALPETSMRIQCQCGQFQAELGAFPKSTPGRIKCYCDDCQMYLVHLGRVDLLDAVGGTEIIPVYPSDVAIMAGAEHLCCTRLSGSGMHRWSTTCCNSPVGNTRPGMPWLGLHRNMFTVKDPEALERALGAIRGRVMGKFAKGPVPPRTAAKMSFAAAIPFVPFILKGVLLRKARPSPFEQQDGEAMIAAVKVLSADELANLRSQWRAIKSYH